MKSKTLATWVALIGGSLGLHRFYLHGLRDRWGWLFLWPTLVGLYGVQRMRQTPNRPMAVGSGCSQPRRSPKPRR